MSPGVLAAQVTLLAEQSGVDLVGLAPVERFRYLFICVGRGCLDHPAKTGRIEAAFETPMIERER